MDPKEKQRLLTIEFVNILKKAREICEKCEGVFYNIGDDRNISEQELGDINHIITQNSMLKRLIAVAQSNLSTSFSAPENLGEINFENIQAIQTFQRELRELLPSIEESDEQKKAYQKQDVVSAQLSILGRIEMDLTRVLRGLFQTLEAIFTGKKIEADQPNLGETRFALRVTGQSQFFPRPMASLKDAELALDDISKRLNECIDLNNTDDDDYSDTLKI